MDSGNTAWMLVSAALVLFMTPGLAFFYGGMVRSKNVLGMLMQNFAAMGLMAVLWVLVGFSLAFGDAGNAGVIGNLDFVGFDGVTGTNVGPEFFALSIPFILFAAYQMTFAIITPALITGATADRLKFGGYMAFIGAWLLLVYTPVAHWVFAGGWLADLGALDFAGGAVVHINAGAAALGVILVVGKRRGYGRTAMPPHSLPLTLLGTGILWFGWTGFNAGSALGANGVAAQALMNTFIAAAAALLSWILVERIRGGHATTLGAASGAVAGLVAITPASGFVLPGPSLLIGVVAGLSGFWGATALKHMCGYDDSLDAFGVHGICGIVGSLMVGYLAYGPLSATAALPEGSAGSFEQFLKQVYATAAVFAFSAIGTFVLLKVTEVVVGLRVPEEEEREGLDVTQHGERIA
jgi:ammonium transporter, Amt family